MNKYEQYRIIIAHIARIAEIANVSIVTARQYPRIPGTKLTYKNDRNIYIVDYANMLTGS
jgi:hypothetical protein